MNVNIKSDKFNDLLKRTEDIVSTVREVNNKRHSLDELLEVDRYVKNLPEIESMRLSALQEVMFSSWESFLNVYDLYKLEMKLLARKNEG